MSIPAGDDSVHPSTAMSLCSEHVSMATPRVSTPRTPRSGGQWTAKAVLDALSDALCKFLDTHYFAPDDDILTNTKAEEMYMDNIPTSKKGIEWQDEADEDEVFMAEHTKADIKLHAYESVIMETPPDVLEIAEVVITPREAVVAEGTPANPPAPQPAPAPAVDAVAKAPKKGAKVKKAKRSKTPKATAVPRAVAADTRASSSSPKASKAAAPLRKLTSARKVAAKQLVRV